MVGLLVGSANLIFNVIVNSPHPGDFVMALRTAFTITHGIDPYGFTPDPEFVPYPLPVALFGFPFLWLIGVAPLYFAGTIFMGISAGLLTWAMLRANEEHR